MEIEWKKEEAKEEISSFRLSDIESDENNEDYEQNPFATDLNDNDFNYTEKLEAMNRMAPTGGKFHAQLGEYVLGDPIHIENATESEIIIPKERKPSLDWDNNFWKECEFNNEIPGYKNLKYTRPQKPSPFTSTTKPHEIFSYFLDKSFMQHLMANTNSYAEMMINTTKGKSYLEDFPSSRNKNWKPLQDTTKIRLYIAALIYMGIVKQPGTKGNLDYQNFPI